MEKKQNEKKLNNWKHNKNYQSIQTKNQHAKEWKNKQINIENHAEIITQNQRIAWKSTETQNENNFLCETFEQIFSMKRHAYLMNAYQEYWKSGRH